MAISRTRNDPTRLFLRRLLLLGLFGLVVFAAWSVWGAWQKEQESASLRQQSQAALVDLSTQQTTLQSNIDSLQSDRGREAALRQEYAVGKQGEDLVIIVDSSTTPPVSPPPSFLDRIRNAFSHW
jgi:cell division protein FtsB